MSTKTRVTSFASVVLPWRINVSIALCRLASASAVIVSLMIAPWGFGSIGSGSVVAAESLNRAKTP
jgi:hypothetical protein